MTSVRGVLGRMGLRRSAPASEEAPREVRDEVEVSGVVREVLSLSRGATSDLMVSLEGEPTSLVWWGREAIPGLHSGVQVTAHGRPGLYRNQPALLNPTYELGMTHE